MNDNKQTAGETAIQVFSSEQFGTIRATGTPDAPWFCLADLCRVLEIQNSSDAKKKLNKKGVDLIYTPTKSGNQKLLFINEQNLYRLIMRSDKPQAEPFQDWVCGEVLPSIRKTGGYIAAKADESPELVMARALKLADDTIRRQQADIEEQNTLIKQQDGLIAEQNDQLRRLIPLEGYVRNALESGTTYTMTEVAQFVGFARVADFLDWAVRAGVLYRLNGRWMPTTDFLGKGYFTTRVYRRMANAACIEESYYTVVTESGRLMFYQRMEEWTDPTPPKRIEAPRNADHFTAIEEGGAL